MDRQQGTECFNPLGLAAWALAALVGIALMLSPSLSGGSAPLTFVVAWGIYALGRGLARHGATAA